MKPTLTMEGKTQFAVSGLPQSDVEKKPKLVKRVVIGTIAFVTVAVVISVSIYFGMKITKDTYKEVWQTYKNQDGSKVEEKVTVTEDSVDIYVPNEMEVIYDYKHGLVVRRFIDSKTKIPGPCYASYINDSHAADPNADWKDGETEMGEDADHAREEWTFTTNPVPRYMQSEEVQEMCKDTSVYWMEGGKRVEKRGICDWIMYYYTYCYYYSSNGYLCKACEYWHHCLDENIEYTGWLYVETAWVCGL